MARVKLPRFKAEAARRVISSNGGRDAAVVLAAPHPARERDDQEIEY
jgi:hypothetical protein